MAEETKIEKDYAKSHLAGDMQGMKCTLGYFLNSDLYKRDATFRKHVDMVQAAYSGLDAHVKACTEGKK